MNIQLKHIYDFENLLFAYKEARRGKRERKEVMEFSQSLEENLITIQNELMYEMYNQGEYREFYVHEPKKRLIMALPFRDRVVQWAIYANIQPVLDRKFIFDSYACRPGKGRHKAMERVKYWVNGKTNWYYLKLDVHKFFYRIDHDVLLDQYKNHIPNDEIIQLLTHIIKSNDGNLGVPNKAENYRERALGRGMAVGNLISQLSANVYLNALDQFIKHRLKAKYYARYMDDMVFIHRDKKELWAIKEEVEGFLNNELKLSLNDKTSLRKINTGIDWVGARIFPTHAKLRKSTALKMKRNVKGATRRFYAGQLEDEKYKSVIASYRGMTKGVNAHSLKQSVKNIIVTEKNKAA